MEFNTDTIIRQFEYPLPVLKSDVEQLEIETSSKCQGVFTLYNAGGGKLSGQVTSNSAFIRFYPDHFDGAASGGNRINIRYEINMEGFRYGDELRAGAVCMSNGGELYIPIMVRLVRPALTARDGKDGELHINSLEDFASCAREYPAQAKALFATDAFTRWLDSTDFPYRELYEAMVRDPNKEHALENFFLALGLKEPVSIAATEERINLQILPTFRSTVTGSFTLKKTGWGYVYRTIKLKEKSPWLRVMREQVSAVDFNEDGEASIPFTVDASLIRKNLVQNSIQIGNCLVDVTVRRKPKAVIRISKEYYGFEDKGVLMVANNSGKDIMFDITAGDGCLRFEGRRYYIGLYAEIPFDVKMSAFQKAQLSLTRRPSMTADISVNAVIDDAMIKKVFTVTIGDFHNEY